MGIPTVTLLDSNCDPTLADWFIPANDDSVSAVRLVLGAIEEAILRGNKKFEERDIAKMAKQRTKQSVRRKSSSFPSGKRTVKPRSRRISNGFILWFTNNHPF